MEIRILMGGPFPHPCLEQALTTHGPRAQFVVRERRPGHDGASQTSEWLGDAVTITLDASARTVHLIAGSRGVAPLYLIAGGRAGVLHGSWDPADLRDQVDAGAVVAQEIARMLTMRFRYGHQTLFAGMVRLTERSAARFCLDGLTMRYPRPAVHSTPRVLRAGVTDAEVIAVYDQLLANAVAGRVWDPATACVELSGGLDSGNVAVALARRSPGIISSALLLTGGRGRQQLRRRRELIDLIDLGEDVTVPFAEHLPFAPTGRRGRGMAVTPYEDAYDEAKEALVDRLQDRGVRVVFTGVGGDEMVAPTAAEQPALFHGSGPRPQPWIGETTLDLLGESEEDLSPASVINETTLLAQACAAPPFLRVGIWPVHPLADPDLVTFGEWLPADWRFRKRLHRARLAAAGCTPAWLDPPLPENFTPVMRQALHAHGFAHLRRILADGSPLIERGFVDPDGLRAAHDRIVATGFAPRDTELHTVIVMDLALRSFR